VRLARGDETEGHRASVLTQPPLTKLRNPLGTRARPRRLDYARQAS
jgi:hypothetical protein